MLLSPHHLTLHLPEPSLNAKERNICHQIKHIHLPGLVQITVKNLLYTIQKVQILHLTIIFNTVTNVQSIASLLFLVQQ